MTGRNLLVLLALVFALSWNANSARAAINYTETFNTNASNWLTETSTAPTYNATGGVGDSGYISYTAANFNSGAGGFGDPLKLMFRGNAAADASGDAYVGSWLGAGINSLSVAVRHNHTSPLNFYARLAGNGGAGASLANDASYAIAPNTWTNIAIPITNSNPPFTSFGSSTFNGVFSNIQNLQLGLYLPGNTDFAGLRFDLDNVATVPEPSTLSLVGLGSAIGAVMLWRRRRRGVN